MATFPSINDAKQLFVPMVELSLDPFVRAKLRRNGIRATADLLAMSAGELILLRDIGIKSLRMVRRALADRGLCLRHDEHLRKDLPPSRARKVA